MGCTEPGRQADLFFAMARSDNGKKEDRTDFVREAVERELRRRESKPPHKARRGG
jgi:hypothetical protein